MISFLFRLHVVAVLFLVTTSVSAQVRLPEIFSDHMILQRGKPVPVWGKASPNATVSVQFDRQLKTATAGADSNWMVYLDPMKASVSPRSLVVSSGTTKTYQHVLVGDVWICSGQSNMEYPLDRSLKRYASPKREEDPSPQELRRTDKPDAIRYLYVDKILNQYPKLPTKGWFNGKDSLLRTVSAIGYFFAKEIHQETGVPIGIITTSWGGTRIEQWTPDWAYTFSPVFSKEVSSTERKIDGLKPGQMFGPMFMPMVPFAAKGVLWYQGESNAIIEDQQTYPEKFRVFVESWRQLLQDKQLPFYTVQIAPHLYTSRKDPKTHTAELLPEFWEAQAKCLLLPQVDMVVTTDLVDDLKDIHPSYKWTIAKRLALQVLKREYGQRKREAHGPMFLLASRKGNTIVLNMEHAKGLKSNDGKPLSWFSIAGADGRFVPAVAEVKGSRVLVSAAEVPEPMEVRFGWHETAQPNLVNGAGLPAMPFRTGRVN